MSINTPIDQENLGQENLLQRAKDCLEEKSDEIDYLVDICQSSYRAAQINTLAKYLCEGDVAEAKKLLEQVQVTPLESEKQIQETERMIHEILKDPYDALVEQFTTEYENFCEEQHLNTNIPIPENLRDVIIFEFSINWEEKEWVPLWLAHFLIRLHRKTACRDFFIHATKGSML